jgi:hypothetical protein
MRQAIQRVTGISQPIKRSLGDFGFLIEVASLDEARSRVVHAPT